jgi:hypothetical protein
MIQIAAAKGKISVVDWLCDQGIQIPPKSCVCVGFRTPHECVEEHECNAWCYGYCR